MVSEQAVDQHRVAGPGAIRAQIDTLADDADPRRGQESLSQAPLLTILVSPVTIATPASCAVAAIEAATRRSRSTVTPSSMMTAQER